MYYILNSINSTFFKQNIRFLLYWLDSSKFFDKLGLSIKAVARWQLYLSDLKYWGETCSFSRQIPLNWIWSNHNDPCSPLKTSRILHPIQTGPGKHHLMHDWVQAASPKTMTRNLASSSLAIYSIFWLLGVTQNNWAHTWSLDLPLMNSRLFLEKNWIGPKNSLEICMHLKKNLKTPSKMH